MDHIEKLLGDARFREFIDRAFDRVAVEATVEEMADFAFGSVEEGAAAFRKHRTSSSD